MPETDKVKRVIVTGANGFIGRYALPLLVEAGFDVHALSRRTDLEPIEGVTWHSVDIMHEQDIESLCAALNATHLLHLAWYTEHGKFWYGDQNLDWVCCSLSLLKIFIQFGGKRVVFAGSCAEYDWSQGLCSDMRTPCNPATLYGVSKHALHQIAEAYCTQHQVSIAWGRVFFLYGPGELASRFVPAVINGLLRQEEVPCSDGSQIRDFMHVEDVASAFAALLKSDLTGAVNIASGESCTLREIGEMIMQQIKGDGRVKFGALPNRSSDPSMLIADVGRLRDGLNWSPNYILETGLADSISWWKTKLPT